MTGTQEPPTVNYVDLNELQSYICKLLVLEIEANESALARVLREQNSLDLMSRFINDPQSRSLLVRKYSRKEDEDETDSADPSQTSMDCDSLYELTGDIQLSNSTKSTSVLFFKETPYLEADKRLYNQIKHSIYDDKELLKNEHLYVSLKLAPLFKSYFKQTGRSERDGDKMAQGFEKILAELEMGLLHLQQNIDIPDITLPINPIISQTMKRCQEQEKRLATVNDFGDKVEDSSFLNQLQNGVNRWIREIQRVTKFERDPASGTALQEISFWLNLERALLRIQEKRESPEVKLTLDILKKGKRFHATVSFDADTQLKEALAKVNDYNPLMKDFPLDDLLSATDLDKLSSALLAIFNHLRKIRNTKYPLERALKLMEAISRDLTAQLLKVLGTRRLMHIPFAEFERVIAACTKVFTTWENEYDKLQALLREMVKKQREGRIKLTWRVNLAHKRLQNRMENMKNFRQQHEQLGKVITVVLGSTGTGPKDRVDDGFVSSSLSNINTMDTNGSNSLEFADGSMIREVDSAYELVKEIDACDISKEGSDAWDAALKRYEERIDRVESCITARLRDQLGTAKSANEMFRIFSRYNVLFVRPRIKGAIREYQTQLIQRVKDDIETLHESFKVKSAHYHQSKTAVMGRVRDIPPTAGLIIWTKQIERQLLVYMKRVGDILGEGWENHLEGQKLSQDAEKFRLKLDTQAIFDEWCRNVTQRHLKSNEASKQSPIPLFTIESCRARSGNENILKLRVNFMPEVITLAKEVRHLRSLSFRVPLAILNKAHQANQLYPSAMSLIESLKSYERTCDKLEDKSSAKQLVAKMKREVQDQVAEGICLVWDSYKVENYVQGFSKIIYNFEDQVDELLAITEKVELLLESLGSCAYSHAIFTEILTKVQNAVDDLSLHQYSNLGRWVAELDGRIKAKLAVRLQAGIEAWTIALVGDKPDLDDNDQPVVNKLGGDPKVIELQHEIRITNQVMHVSPSVEEARYNLMQQLFAWQNVILTLNRIESTRYSVGLDRSSMGPYKNILTLLPNGLEHLKAAYREIEDKISQMQDYIQQWLAYQSLWDLQPDMLYNRLGDDISLWVKTLIEIKNSRATFDTSETRKRIGPIIIDYARVQSKVSLQYDSWHKDKVMSKFATLLSLGVANLHTEISKARNELELQSIDSAETKDAVIFITYVQNLKSKSKEWERQVEVFKLGQQTLERQRFQFPPNWLHVDNIEGEWSAFNEIMRRRESAIQTQIASLRLKIVAQDQAVGQRTSDLLADWEQSKPIQGSSAPVDALSCLASYESKFSQLKEDRHNIARAKDALELDDQSTNKEHGQFRELSERLDVALEELHDLKGVWSKLSAIWGQIEQLRSLRWSAVQPRELRKSLDELFGQLKEMPSRLQSYASYDYVKSLIKGYQKVNVLIHELKSDALRERHWKQLVKMLNVHWVTSDLTLGKVWDIDLQRNENIIKDVILVAQGELALENFLKQVESSWQEYELDLVVYQNKCALITKWDDLFNKLKEHINSLSAMKLSPYYKQFKDDAIKWEEKLNKISSLFDIWIDVQRRWVYLEGIFSGSSDIQTLMPKENARFKTISSENQSGFLKLMRQVSDKRRVIDVLDIPDVQRNLEWLADQLSATQKALGEYLERERSSFPRFYFVGDEDLLEIIGNSNNISRLQKHFKKMFSGVSSIILSQDGTLIEGVCSREGEELRFVTPVSVKENPKINIWLQMTEREIRNTLACLLAKAVVDMSKFKSGGFASEDYLRWLDTYQAQIAVLAAQIAWSESVEIALTNISKDSSLCVKPLEACLQTCESTLQILADCVLQDQPPIRRKKLEHLITEFVHKRDITRNLIQQRIDSPRSFAWLRLMRFYFDPRQQDVLKQLHIQMSNAKFYYGFEYLGVQDKLVQTPLTDRCYLTMTQALEARLGGSPFGPAGTGKTETVKALGHQLGRFVLVFNCDENFDFQAVGRIFIGLCQVGAWGCFDEFNRLEERMLSAVSQQIQTIQETLRLFGSGAKEKNLTVDLIGRQVGLNPNMAIFITMNPGYAGRSNLPDNLKKLFRPLAMNKPDRQLIAQVMLYSQGFRLAENLANKIVPFFKLCHEQLSSHSHYDFGLRALKNVLVSAGNIKRELLHSDSQQLDTNETVQEQKILMQSVCETMKPKLVADDIPLLSSLLSDVFPNISYEESQMTELHKEIEAVCKEMCLIYGGDESSQGHAWVEKVLQLYQISKLNHGLMLVGPSGCGKSTACKVLLKALERIEKVESVSHVIDPKAISKDSLYGTLDPNTREWSDGLFTHMLRKIIDNVRGEINKRHWIIFDGDVDPEWVENLNSVLDDNKLLTLPNGERLGLPPSVRIIFEVQDLKFATLATVSRCGMIWFSEDVLSTKMMVDNFLMQLRTVLIEDTNATQSGPDLRIFTNTETLVPERSSATLLAQQEIASLLEPHLEDGQLVYRALEFALQQEHIMEFTRFRALKTLFSMINNTARSVIVYNISHPDGWMKEEHLKEYISNSLVFNVLWAFTGDAKSSARNAMSDFIRQNAHTFNLPATQLIDYEVSINNGKWALWQNRVPQIEVETHRVAAPDVVVPTVDTVRHEALLNNLLAEHKPLILCGPPGSGKTMTLFSSLRSLTNMQVVGLNFSSATTPELLLKTFDHYCIHERTPNGVVLKPKERGWLILFCDEINLPAMDNYETIRVISFLRQLVEHRGFWRTTDHTWVKTERIQFVGACNPPTDPGRKPLSHRFLRHVPIIYVDYPGETSLMQIYSTFNRAMLRMVPPLRAYAEQLTTVMVKFYLRSQDRFTQDMQPHYIYSPRELTRWVRGICEAIRPLDTLTIEELVRLLAHEALRLFQDRLVEESERKWTDENINDVIRTNFQGIDLDSALIRPILYSNWLKKDYVAIEREELREFTRARLKEFCEEELDVELVLFNEVLDHVLRIDRVFRQPQGHLLLIGVSGAGKTTLSKFVAWMNGLTIFQIKVHNRYTAANFDEDLRQVLRRAGCRNEKICFILDESNVMDSSFLERMNTLLANGEVPGLFEGDELSALMTQCKEGSQREGQVIKEPEELYRWFTHQVMRNLHVVFTMNPSTEGLKDRASTSPALFNRCVVNWFGDWSDEALYQVGKQFTAKLDIDREYVMPERFPYTFNNLPEHPTHRDAINNAFVYVHQTLHKIYERMRKRNQQVTYITPRHYLDFINQYVKLFHEKCSELQEEQRHLTVGLNRINETVEQVEEMQSSLKVKSAELEAKNAEAKSKMENIIQNREEARKRTKESEELQKALREQETIIAEKRSAVMQDLSKVEPAVKEAQQAVQSIKKQNLIEVRSMTNPPAPVKLAMESICLLLGEPNNDWKSVRSMIVGENFISTIVNFNSENLSDSIRRQMREKYLKNPDYTYEKINRASSACGPLVKWACAQLNYADMVRQIEPLRNELKSLEAEASVNKKKADENEKILESLKSNIQSYEEEYGSLKYEAKMIEESLKSVESKVNRSMALLSSLSSERTRWDLASHEFKSQMDNIAGDVLLSSSFLAYAGFFDQQSRTTLFDLWRAHLRQSQIKFRPDLALTEYLSSPDERLKWQANALPSDDLCSENAIMMKRFNRYPLIIDPSGQATKFLLNEYKDRKITRTSFLDDAFRKNLESALRFGNPLLVQDVENYDPILNPVLNREVRRTAGRVLISLGDQDIDLSPSFCIFLSTRDPSIEFPPDICSRVTFVNFTITKSSLQSQCLHRVLKAERPDIDEKRSNQLKLQGEYQVRLRLLEKSLLQALNDSKGRILDDDSVISTLERLKLEADDISRKVADTDRVIEEVNSVSQKYNPFSTACSSIFFTMDRLNQVHSLYQYSLDFFLGILDDVLNKNTNLDGITDKARRLDVITENLFENVYRRITRGMLHDDWLLFATLLCRIHLKVLNPEQNHEKGFDYYLRNRRAGPKLAYDIASNSLSESDKTSPTFSGVQWLSNKQNESLESLTQSCLEEFKTIDQTIVSQKQSVKQWLDSARPELSVPALWNSNASPASPNAQAIRCLILIQALRPDRVPAMTEIFVRTVLGAKFVDLAETDVQLGTIVDKEIKASTPVLLCSAPGYDASGRVDDLAAEMSRPITSIAMGSAEGFYQAEVAINGAAKSGKWVMLKNVHLAPQWLVQLEKKLYSLEPNANFRLFLTLEIHPKIPVNLLRAGRIFVYEPPPGIKANLLRTFNAIAPAQMMRAPSERSKLYFLLAWFHAIVQERLRYKPLGWSKLYEFNESDLKVAASTLDTWLDSAAQGRNNISPDKIPWDAIQTLFGECIYGGKVDNIFDHRLLKSFLKKFFVSRSFESDFALVEGRLGSTNSVLIPEGIRRDEFLAWVDSLDHSSHSPTWLGLPSNAERVILFNLGQDMIRKLLRLQALEDEDEVLVTISQRAGDSSADSSLVSELSGGDVRPTYMKTLAADIESWLKYLPDHLELLKRSVENIKDPLFRYFEREVCCASRLLSEIRKDLNELAEICDPEKRVKQTNYYREMVEKLVKEQIPEHWIRYKVPNDMKVSSWMIDFGERLRQLAHVLENATALRRISVNLGKLLNPEAYITATRQFVAQTNSWSLEELELEFTVHDAGSTTTVPGDESSFIILNLQLEGATVRENKLHLTAAMSTEIPKASLHWMRKDSVNRSASEQISLPVYLDSTRSDPLFTVEMQPDGQEDVCAFFERGVAIICCASAT